LLNCCSVLWASSNKGSCSAWMLREEREVCGSSQVLTARRKGRIICDVLATCVTKGLV
jgi:hypothetical protein